METPEERRAGQSVESIVGEPNEIAFVCIPSDTSKPMEERTVQVPAGYRGDYLVEYLQTAFRGNSDRVDISLLQQQAQQTLAASPDTPSTVSDKALKQVAEKASVETFTLVHPSPSNQFTSIHIYLDEVGMLKRLPLNTRASSYAERAGFSPPPQFFGDVFLGRIQKRPALRNLPFNLGVDTAPEAPWLCKAISDNLEYQKGMNEMTGRTDVRQPDVVGSEGKAKQEDGFHWTQTDDELEVCVPIPDTAKSKDLLVKFRPRDLSVTVLKESRVNIHLFEQVDVDGCTWTIDRKGGDTVLVVTMEKAESALWPRIVN